jgi:uncharacterized protein HemY
LADIPADAKDVRYSLLNTLGAVLYRAGSYQQAIDRFNEGLALHGSKGQLQDWIFLAMAHHQLGHSKEVAKWLELVNTRGANSTLQFKWENLEADLLAAECQRLVAAGK